MFLGNESETFVQVGNVQMVITALLVMLSFWCDNVPVLEQPLYSTMTLCPPLATVFAHVAATRVVTWHKAFGSDSMKPLQILSSSNIIEVLRRPKPREASKSLTRHGAHGYTGIKNRLRLSQAYTPMFGRAVADMIKTHLTTRAVF